MRCFQRNVSWFQGNCALFVTVVTSEDQSGRRLFAYLPITKPQYRKQSPLLNFIVNVFQETANAFNMQKVESTVITMARLRPKDKNVLFRTRMYGPTGYQHWRSGGEADSKNITLWYHLARDIV